MKEEYQFSITADALNKDNFEQLQQRKHERGLRHLLDKGVFADYDGSSQVVQNVLQKFGDDAMRRSEGKKEKEVTNAKRKINAGKQRTLFDCAKKQKDTRKKGECSNTAENCVPIEIDDSD